MTAAFAVRDVDDSALRDTIARLLVDINYEIPPDVLDALRQAVDFSIVPRKLLIPGDFATLIVLEHSLTVAESS